MNQQLIIKQKIKKWRNSNWKHTGERGRRRIGKCRETEGGIAWKRSKEVSVLWKRRRSGRKRKRVTPKREKNTSFSKNAIANSNAEKKTRKREREGAFGWVLTFCLYVSENAVWRSDR